MRRLQKLWYKLNTALKLRLGNILVVVLYRILKRGGYYQLRCPIKKSLNGPFLSDELFSGSDSCNLKFFSYHDVPSSSPPDWFVNPWNGNRHQAPNQHWSKISDYIPELGDIKTVWETSRFDWLPRMAWRYRKGLDSSIGQIELWVRDWVEKNPPNCGINWKCGQEAAFRSLNMILANILIVPSSSNPRPGVLRFLDEHLKRIEATFQYGIAQDNNHGLSEAAALFVAGEYLTEYGDTEQVKKGKRWSKIGRHNLEKRVQKLILADGSFSQHSTTYHRLMLDALSFVELFRTKFAIPEFTNHFYDRVPLAVKWLHNVLDPLSGNVPNLGANDGSYLFNLNDAEYRDFRPSVQLGAAVFLCNSAYKEIVLHPLLETFNLDIDKFPEINRARSLMMADGGYACIRDREVFALLRLPVYRFRPSHADSLHFDLWRNGINWARDSGTYSYNTETNDLEYFPGTQSHNTVCFDSRDQMPRLGRFLFGQWLNPDVVDWREEEGYIRAGFTDYKGVEHIREVKRVEGGLRVSDTFKGFEKEATIRWHLAPANWILQQDMILRCDQMELSIESRSNLELSLTELPESLYYMEKHLTPVLEVVSSQPSEIISTFKFL